MSEAPGNTTIRDIVQASGILSGNRTIDETQDLDNDVSGLEEILDSPDKGNDVDDTFRFDSDNGTSHLGIAC